MIKWTRSGVETRHKKRRLSFRGLFCYFSRTSEPTLSLSVEESVLRHRGFRPTCRVVD